MKKTVLTGILVLSLGTTAFAAAVPGAGVSAVSYAANPVVQSVQPQAAQAAVQESWDSIVNWDKGADADIVVLGFGRKGEGGTTLMARRAAIVDGYRNLAEVAGGVQVNSESTVRDMIAENDVVRTNVSAVVKGAQIIAEGTTPEGDYYVKMSLPLFGEQQSVAAAVLPEAVKNVQPAVPAKVTKKNTALPKAEFKEVKSLRYSGIVVDCRGLGLDCTFAPQILDVNGRGVYGIENIDPDFAVSKGMVEYSRDLAFATSGKSRAGSNPLVVKAVAVKGGTNSKNQVNAVLTAEDADKVLLAMSNNDSLLENAAVVFVR